MTIDRRLFVGGGLLCLSACTGLSDQALRERYARRIAETIFTPEQFEPYLAPLRQAGGLGAQMLALATGVNLGPIVDAALDRLVEERIGAVQARAAEALAAEFTTEELRALLDAYQAPGGREAAARAFSLGASGALPPGAPRASLPERAERVVAGSALAAFGLEFDTGGELRDTLIRETTRALTGQET